jgi:hypothetical protein
MSDDADSLYWQSVAEEPSAEAPEIPYDQQLVKVSEPHDVTVTKEEKQVVEKAKYVYKPKEILWTPSVSYAKTLSLIQAQRTPSELYRHKLETVGRHARDMQRLEWRWSHNVALWTNCSSRVKAGWRGMKGRIYFRSVRDALVIKREQREAKINATSLYNKGSLHAAADLISGVHNLTPELQFMKSQFYYQLQDYPMCIASCKKGIGNTTI